LRVSRNVKRIKKELHFTASLVVFVNQGADSAIVRLVDCLGWGIKGNDINIDVDVDSVGDDDVAHVGSFVFAFCVDSFVDDRH